MSRPCLLKAVDASIGQFLTENLFVTHCFIFYQCIPFIVGYVSCRNSHRLINTFNAVIECEKLIGHVFLNADGLILSTNVTADF